MSTSFGLFLSSVHEPGQDPHLVLQRDLELTEMADNLNLAEVWFGEHHSMGWGLIGAPETMIAAAAQRTSRIRLGHGVVPLSWHHPFHVASRAMHLDHLSRGRYILGVGPGVPSDARMLGVEMSDQRARLARALPVVIELVNGSDRITDDAGWYEVRDAKVQLPRYTEAGLEIAVASAGTTLTSPQLAGQYGISMLSFGLSQPGSQTFISLAEQWRAAEESAARHGRRVDRRNWRIALPLHVADTRAEALADVREGFDRWLHGYWGAAIGRDVSMPGVPAARELEARMDVGGLIIGSPDDVVSQLSALQERSGGFGTFLNYVLDWTTWEKTQRSLELLARYVAPQLNGAARRPQESIDFAVRSREARTAALP